MTLDFPPLLSSRMACFLRKRQKGELTEAFILVLSKSQVFYLSGSRWLEYCLMKPCSLLMYSITKISAFLATSVSSHMHMCMHTLSHLLSFLYELEPGFYRLIYTAPAYILLNTFDSEETKC